MASRQRGWNCKSVFMALAISLVTMFHGTVEAQGTLYDLYNNLDILEGCPLNDCWSDILSPDVRHAQQFVLGNNSTIDEVTIQLIRTGANVTGSMSIELWSDDGNDDPLLPNDPQSLIAVLGEIPDVSQMARVRSNYTFTKHVTGLEPREKYWIVANYEGLDPPLGNFRGIGLAHTYWPASGGNFSVPLHTATRGVAGTNGATQLHATKRPYNGWDELIPFFGGQHGFAVMSVKTGDQPFHGVSLPVGETYTQNFDTLGIDGQTTGKSFPSGWSYTEDERFFGTSETTKAFPAGTSLGRSTPIYNAGNPNDADRALALGVTRGSLQPMLQLVADVVDSNATSFQLQFDVETWDTARNADLPGEAAFDVALDIDTGGGFVPLVDLGTVTTEATLWPSATSDQLNGNFATNRTSFDSGPVEAVIPENAKLRVRWLPDTEGSTVGWVYGLDNVSLSLYGDDIAPQLMPGDADQDADFDQLDLVQVQVASKYLTGQTATWGEGDWDGAPGGSPDNPPTGDRLFNQFDIIAAQQGNTYLTGPYAVVRPDGTIGDGQTSVVYNSGTGELSVDAPAGLELTSINIDSTTGIFTGEAAHNLGGSFDNDADNNIFKATFGGSFGSLSFGNVAQSGLSEEFVLGDLSVVGSLAGGGDLGNVDLVYVPEPTSVLLLSVALGIGLLNLRRVNR